MLHIITLHLLSCLFHDYCSLLLKLFFWYSSICFLIDKILIVLISIKFATLFPKKTASFVRQKLTIFRILLKINLYTLKIFHVVNVFVT